MLEQITDNAVTEEVVVPQETVEEQPEVSEPVEVAPTTEEVVQSPEENAKFKELRLKHEKETAAAVQKAKDDLIAEQYGESHGIRTEAEFKKAMAQQKQKELLDSLKDSEKDPTEVYNSLKENDPDYQELKRSREEAFVKTQLDELNNDLKSLEIDKNINSLDDLVKLDNAQDVIKYVEKGMTLSEAYFLANKQNIIQSDRSKIQQQTIKQIEANGSSTPGALSDTGDTAALFTEAQVENMTQAEVNKNYDLIMKSMKSW